MSLLKVRGLPLVGALIWWSQVLSFPSVAEGQELDRVHFGVGYVVNAPDQMAGASGYVLFPNFGGIGIYLDVKGDIDSPSGERAFDNSLTSAEVEVDPRYAGTRFLKRETSWKRSFNVALIRPLSRFMMVYGGGGLSTGEQYALYDVPTGQVGEVGRALWVRDPRGDEDRVNLMLGLILRVLPGVASQLGFETHPGGFTAGVSLRLPPW